MKRYTLSFAESLSHVPTNPERTAKRSMGWDVNYQEWSNRAAMAKSIRLQEKHEIRRTDWKACVALRGNEGY